MPVNDTDAGKTYRILLFKNVTAVMKAEKILLKQSIPHKIIPVPKSISTECGVCLRFSTCDEEHVLKAIEGVIEYVDLRAI